MNLMFIFLGEKVNVSPETVTSHIPSIILIGKTLVFINPVSLSHLQCMYDYQRQDFK